MFDISAQESGTVRNPTFEHFAAMELEHCTFAYLIGNLSQFWDFQFQSHNDAKRWVGFLWEFIVHKKNWESVDKSFYRELKKIGELMNLDVTISAKLT